MEDDRDELKKNYGETCTGRRYVSRDQGGQRKELRGDKEEANYGGERISFSFEK